MVRTYQKEIKKRWQEYTELYKKGLDNQDGVVTHLEPDILQLQCLAWMLKLQYSAPDVKSRLIGKDPDAGRD